MVVTVKTNTKANIHCWVVMGLDQLTGKACACIRGRTLDAAVSNMNIIFGDSRLVNNVSCVSGSVFNFWLSYSNVIVAPPDQSY